MNRIKILTSRWLYLVIAVIIFILALVLLNFYKGNLHYEQARIYIETMQVLATLALIYFAYKAFIGAQQKSITTAELTVRPDLNWQLLHEKGRIYLRYFSLDHPAYDLMFEITAKGRKQVIEERHLDVHKPQDPHIYSRDITEFVRKAFKNTNKVHLEILLTFHSEIGGKYQSAFLKEIIKKNGGYDFKHRKILWASYPWSEKIIRFD